MEFSEMKERPGQVFQQIKLLSLLNIKKNKLI